MPFDLKKVLDERQGENFTLHSKYINPQLPKVLGQIEFDRFYEKGEGCYLIDDKGDRYLDFLSGFGVFALGRSHPTIVRALHDALDADLPNLVQMDCSLLSGVLAEELVTRSHSGIERVFFTNSGAEAVETAIKFARAATKRTRILYCDHAFHGLTTGALALNGGKEFRTGFGPLLPGADVIPFGDAAALARELRRGDVAAFIAEPIQGKGVYLAPEEFWQEAQSLCRRHKALMILDEVQAGMGRSGTFFCHEQFGITPDIITVSKALSGGYVPVGAMLSTAAVSDAVYSSMEKAVVHSSTFSTNQLAMVAGLATLAAFEDEDILDRVRRTGKAFTKALQPLVERYEFLHEVRGMGLMIGLVFGEPSTPGLRRRFKMVEADPARAVLPNGGDPAVPPASHPHAGGGRQRERRQAPAAPDRGGRRGGALRRRARGRVGQRRAGVEPDLRVRQDDGQRHAASGAAVNLDSGDRVLVTGASGFIGSAVTRQLVAREQEVIALVEPGADTANLDGLDVKQVVGDLRSGEDVQSAVNGCRAVFHVAALYRFWARDPETFYAINVDGTRNVLDAAAEEAGVERLVYTSTVGTLGLEHVSGSRSADERSFPDVRHLYGSYKRSKYVAEHEVLRAIAEGLPASLVLPTFPVGPGDRAPTPTGKLVLDFLNGRMPAYVDTVLNVAHVDDLAAGHVLALEKGRTGRSYILGGENLTLQQVLAELAIAHRPPGSLRQGAQFAGPRRGRRLRAGGGSPPAPAPVRAAGGGADVDLPDVLRHQPGP